MAIFFIHRKNIAITLLLILGFNVLLPLCSYALTSGPAQPEAKGFQVATVSDMVDLESGSMKYNIPLLDIDGYPINLSYQSGSGMDDEASWVGLGWSLNPGAINRQVRGLPDDYSGDTIETDHYVKPKVTVGGRLTAKTEAFGLARVGGSFSFGIFNDNYTGIGAELGVNAGISLSLLNDGLMTAGLGAGVLSNTQSGVDASISPYVSMSVKTKQDDNQTVNPGLSASFGYNTRSGAKALTLGTSFGAANYDQTFNFGTQNWDLESGGANYSIGGSSITYNTEPISPTISVPYKSSYGSFSLEVGGAAIGIFGSIGGTGYQNVRSVQNIINIRPAFGFLYADRGAGNLNAVMDFFREKDNPVIPGLPDIAIPVHTPDIWSFTSQTGSGQFRLFRGGSGAFFDTQASDLTSTSTYGADFGFGLWAHGGVTNYNQSGKTTTQKWTSNNSYLPSGDFQPASNTAPGNQPVYFRMVGEKSIEDQHADSVLAGNKALQVAISGTTAQNGLRTSGNIYGSPQVSLSGQFGRTYKRPSRTMISYLTASEASKGALDTGLNSYVFVDSTMINALPSTPRVANHYTRVDRTNPISGYVRKPHHISEMTVTDETGKRMVYGIPVYNLSQDEFSFAINPATRDAKNLVSVPSGIVTNPAGNRNGIDNYYHRERKPSYPTSYLLSAVLSPDYVDRTGNGITDDDLGTAVKFNYSKLGHSFNWRTPYNRATPNRCLTADPDDDKGSIVFGTKEIWYVQSIETKTKIAYFLTADRRDALGSTTWQNGGRSLTNTQKCLMQIRLYSKADTSKPIKVVKFQYDYSLCRGVPNSLDSGTTNTTLGGKLTLKRVLFEYGNATKGKYHPYVFAYNTTVPGSTPVYTYQSTDRWGTYKQASENAIKLDNEQYPYADQNKTNRDAAGALWQLSQITLPTGGTIDVTYESGDYSYVQNQKAMTMKPIESLIKTISQPSDTNRGLTYGINGLRINIGTDTVPPGGIDQTKWFENTFLNGSQYLYTKLYVNMVTSNDPSANPFPYDAVPTYCQISSVSIASGKASIMFVPITAGGVTANPMSICAWQRMKNEYPRYAYPGFNNRVQSQNNSVLAAASAVINAARNLSELREDFYQKAKGRNYDTLVIVGQSYAKLVQTNGIKLGGPVRVKKVQIDDNWNTTANPHALNASYGQAYSYTTTENGKTISSGVAAYEPSIGNDENPLKQPIPYVQNIKGAINNFFELETPLGESFYPAPGICYSKVTVNDLDQNHNPSTLTGSIVNEFYTSKDFPVQVTALPLITSPEKKSNHYSLTRTDSDDELCLSQGYSVLLNDMQGKTKATTVYDQAGAVISATQYYYSSTNNGGIQTLNNKVNVIDPTSQALTPKILGQDIDFFTDFREQVSSNLGQAINVGGDIFPLTFFLPFFGLPHFPVNDNNDYKLFRSACAVKVIQDYGILSKVVKTENGSTITTENLAFDQLTGEALVTRTTNEFHQPIYSVNIPAYWAYTRMGAAYQNLGIVISGLATDSHGQVTNTAYKPFLQAGDEILDTNDGSHYWVINNAAFSGGGNTLKLIDRNGYLKVSYTALSLDKVIRSGYRNMLSANTSTIVMLASPFTQDNSHLNLMTSGNLAALKVINTSATTYDETWGMGNICSNTSYAMEQHTPYALIDTSIVPGSEMHALTKNFTKAVFWFDTSSFVRNLIDTPSYFRTQSFYAKTAIKSSFLHVGPDSVQQVIIDTCIYFDGTKNYCIGIGGSFKSSLAGFAIDDTLNYTGVSGALNDTAVFNLVAIKKLSTGNHRVEVVIGYDEYAHGGRSNPWANFGIYQGSVNSLVTNRDTTGSTITTIYNSSAIKSDANVRSSYVLLLGGFEIEFDRYTTPSGGWIDPCTPINLNPIVSPRVINPYVSGFLGNWRSFQTKVFQVNRSYTFSGNLNSASIAVKKAGYLQSFFPYWYWNTGNKAWLKNPSGTSWVTANTVTVYDKYGQQLENVDALGRYSAANFDFFGELPSAVASNAMNREIYAASLEDSYFTPGNAGKTDTCNVREFMQPSTGKTIKQLATNRIAHSGNYSALLRSDGVTLSTIIDTLHQKANAYLGTDASRQYTTVVTPGLYPNGFEPYPGKKYLFDAWVWDSHATDKNIYLTLSYNGINVPLKCKAEVEGWKLVEGTMDLSVLGHASSLTISVTPNTGSNIYIDDIRMQPFQAMMKTYAYDAGTMRLMAELDENGFATFYEYDDEGLLVRVKKETEKGIMTLKESRSTYRKNIH